MPNLAAKYRPSRFEDVQEQSTVIDIVKKLCDSDELESRNFLFTGPAGCGKAQPMDSKVLTTSGYIAMRDVELGQEIFTGSGNLGHVVGLYPQGIRPIYNITFDDGSSIQVSDEHLNVVYRVNSDGSKIYDTYTTSRLIDLVENDKEILYVDTLSIDWRYVYGPNVLNFYQCLGIDINEVDDVLKNLQVTMNDDVIQFEKCILYSIFHNYDATHLHNTYELCVYNYSTSQAITELVRWSGCVDRVSFCNDVYHHTIVVPKLLQSSESDLPFVVPPRRQIVNICYCKDAECQCIYVDHSDHTYITDNLVPTHNTTICRIIANQLNDGVGEPIEVDAASNSGVEAMRDIIAQARTYPVGSKWKIFIIDEVHALSAAAWSAALKTFEEVPARTIFLMATTNPEKIPPTILSRVQVFRLSKISLGGIESRLKYIIDKENECGEDITYTDDAITYIAKMSNGGMRDAITLLEKAIASSHTITSESLVSALGLPDYNIFFNLLAACASHDNSKIANIIDTVYNSGANYVKWMSDFHAFVINVGKYILLQDITRTTIPSHYVDKISKYGTAHLSICLKLANKLLKLNQDLKNTQYLQEVTLTYLCTPTKK